MFNNSILINSLICKINQIKLKAKYLKHWDVAVIFAFKCGTLCFQEERLARKAREAERAEKAAANRPPTVFVQIQRLGPKETFVSCQ